MKQILGLYGSKHNGKYPDLRFWQLLENIKCQYGCEHGISGDMVDLWFLEDDQTLDMIRGFKLK